MEGRLQGGWYSYAFKKIEKLSNRSSEDWDRLSADQARTAFGTIVLGLAQSGMQTLDDETIGRVFGGVIEQARLDMEGLRAEYEELLQSKYGEPIESILARIPVRYFPVAVTQIAAEIAQGEAGRRRAAEARSLSKDETIRQLEKRMKPLERYKAKLERKKSRKKKPGNKKKRQR